MRRKIKRILMVPVEWLGILLGLLFGGLLPYRGLLVLCDIVSVIAYRIDRRGRVRSMDNLRTVMGQCDRDDRAPEFDPDSADYAPTAREALIIRRAYRNMARTIGHVFWTMCFAKRRVATAGELSPSCAAFLAANRPVIAVSGHIGSWEILSQLAFLSGHRMMSVAKRIGTHGMTAMLMRARKSIGQEIVSAKGAMKPLLNGLCEGKSLGLLVDQKVRPAEGGQWIRFFGQPLPVSVAPAFFLAKTGVPIIVAWSRPLKDGRYRCEMLDAITVEDFRRDGIWGVTQRIAHDFERVIRRHPSCWALNYNLYSNRPTEKDLTVLKERELKWKRGAA